MEHQYNVAHPSLRLVGYEIWLKYEIDMSTIDLCSQPTKKLVDHYKSEMLRPFSTKKLDLIIILDIHHR